MIKYLDKNDDFQQIIANNKHVIVDFYADWCGPCRMLGRSLESLEEEFKDIMILKVNVDEFEQISSQFHVMSIPYLLAFKEGKRSDFVVGGEKQDSILGALPEENLKEVLKNSF